MKTPTFISFLPLLVALLAFVTNVAEGRRTSDFRLSSPAKRAPTSTSNANLPNAERLRRGLSPVTPRRLYNPTRVKPRDPGPSYVPTAHDGYIKVVRVSDNTHLGYIPSQYLNPPPSSYAWYGVSPADRLLVRFTPPASGVFDIEIRSSGKDYPFLGLTGSAMPSPTDPDPYQQNLGRVTQTNQTPAGSAPADVLNGRWPYSLYSESAVWQFDHSTKEITAIWVSENLAVYPVHFYNFFGVGAHVDGLAFTTNTLTYHDLLDLYLVPQNNQEKVRFVFEPL